MSHSAGSAAPVHGLVRRCRKPQRAQSLQRSSSPLEARDPSFGNSTSKFRSSPVLPCQPLDRAQFLRWIEPSRSQNAVSFDRTPDYALGEWLPLPPPRCPLCTLWFLICPPKPWLASAETDPQRSPIRAIRGWLLRRASRISRGVVTTDHTALQISPIRAIRAIRAIRG